MSHDQLTPDAVNEFVAREFPGTQVRAHELGDRWAIGRLDAEAGDIRPGGIISGPSIFGLADATLWYALFTAVGIEPMALTSELSIRYLRPAKGTSVFARADLHHVGRRSVIGSVRCWVDDAVDKPVAVAQGTYVRPTTPT